MTSPTRKVHSPASFAEQADTVGGGSSAPLDKVQVVCRIRPADEYGESCVSIEQGVGGDILDVDGLDRRFHVTKAFGEESRQEDIFDYVGAPSINYVLQGFCVCIFAYGQTGSGKTFTMNGTRHAPGLVPRMITTLFSQLVASFQDFTVTCQYLEIYMEKVRDLFNPSRAKNPWDAPGPKLNIRYDGKRVNVENGKRLTFGNDPGLRRSVQSDQEYVEVLSGKLLHDVEDAARHRTVRGHALNAESSRSHAVLSLDVTARRKNGQNIASTIMLVDLAGSENIGKAHVEGIGKEEAKSINKSLFSLTRCIEALAIGQKVPFRESALTKILTPALDGRSCCTLIAALRGDHASETRETLKFTETALKVKVKPKQLSSEALGAVQSQAREVSDEIQALRQEIEWLKQSGANSDALSKMLKEKEELLRAKVNALATLQREIRDQEEQLSSIQKELDVSKQEAERERAARLRAEAEAHLLRARMSDAEARRQSESKKQIAKTRQRFDAKKTELLQELAGARSHRHFEEAVEVLLRLVRHFEEDLQARVDEQSHHARHSLLQDLQEIAACLEQCLRVWSELSVRLEDFKFILQELLAQSSRMSQMASDCKPQVSDGDLMRYQMMLEEVWRVGRHATSSLVGSRRETPKTCVRDAKSAPVDSSSSTSRKAAGLQASVWQIASALSESVVRWRNYKRIWNEHFKPKLCSAPIDRLVPLDRASSPLEELGVDDPETRFVEVDVDSVSVVADELQEVFDLFNHDICKLLATDDRNAIGGAVGDSSAADTVWKDCLCYVEVQANADTEDSSTAYAKSIMEECQMLVQTETPQPACEAQMDMFGSRWQDVSAALYKASEAVGEKEVRKQVEDGLKRLQLHRLCEEESLWKHLAMPPPAFVKDLIKCVHADLSMFREFGVEGFAWNDTWAQGSPKKLVKVKFFKKVCQIIHDCCSHWGWPIDFDVDAVSRAMLQGGEVVTKLGFVARFCLIVERCIAEEFCSADRPVAKIADVGENFSRLCVWIGRLRTRVAEWCMHRRKDMEERLMGSELDIETMKETIRGLRREQASTAESQRLWEEERASLLKELHRAKSENIVLTTKLEASQHECAQKLREEAEHRKGALDEANSKISALQEELRIKSNSVEAAQPADFGVVKKQRVATAKMLAMVRDTKDSVEVWEGGQQVNDLFGCLDSLLLKQLETLRELTGESRDKAAKVDLAMVGKFIKGSRAEREEKGAAKRLREAKCFAQSESEVAEASLDADEDPDLDAREHLRAVLVSLADQQANIGSVRLQEERALMAYMRTSLQKAWARGQELAARIAELEARKRHEECGDNGADGEAAARSRAQDLLTGVSHFGRAGLRSLASSLRTAVDDAEVHVASLEENHPEFCQLKAHAEGTASRAQGLSISVRRVRKICNTRLEAEFYEGIAEHVRLEAQPTIIRNVFHGTQVRMCELVAEEGLILPKELGLKPGRYGNAVHFANHSCAASGDCVLCPGRLRSMLLCDIAPGRVYTPSLHEDGQCFIDMTVEQLRSFSENGDIGYDSIFVPASHGEFRFDEYAIYDPRLALPRYIIDFDVDGLGTESLFQDAKAVKDLQSDVADLKAHAENSKINDIRDKYRQIAGALRDATGYDEFCLVDVPRGKDPALWDRCSLRLLQGTSDGVGLAPGLEVVMTKLERIVNPTLACKFYERAAELMYPEEAFKWLFHGGTAAQCLRVAKLGFSADDTEDVSRAEDSPKSVHGHGVCFSTAASRFLGCSPGSHRLVLCEVALGKSMLVQSSRRTFDLESIRRAGFDSVHVPRSGEDSCDEWVLYDFSQALPAYLLSYDVQPKAVAAQLLKEVAALDERKRILDEQLAAVLQELEDARRDAERTRLQLDERLAQQLVAEENHLMTAKNKSRAQQERLDEEQASQLQELEKARKEVDDMKVKLAAMESARIGARVQDCTAVQHGAQESSSPTSSSGANRSIGMGSRYGSLPSLVGRR